jgi:tetratricopeptide (TPR) repeat protein
MRKKRENETDFQIRFYENILKTTPDFIEALIAIGDLYTQKNMVEQGLAVDLRLSRLRPNDGGILYNLACSYSLMREIDKAFGAMKLALECGYDDLNYLEVDDDLEHLRKDERFQEYYSRYRREKVAQSKP